MIDSDLSAPTGPIAPNSPGAPNGPDARRGPLVGSGAASRSALSPLRWGARQLLWFLRGVMGEDAYDRYLEFYGATHEPGDHPPMSEREFWRDRDDRQDSNPQSRCC